MKIFCVFIFFLLLCSTKLSSCLTFSLSRDELNTLRIKIAEATPDEPKDEEAELVNLIQSNQDPANIYAVLVAGSSGYQNYRHQADVCHAYHIFHRNGIPDENIVVMMYDDVANSTENPTPGIIVNRPNGTNVYEGVVKDYIGTDVNPDTFIKVLLGDEHGVRGRGSGKVLKSGPNDHVFINFVDHGAPGLIAFPSDELHAKLLKRTLLKMHKQHKFQKLVFYLEACESGSMFEKLLPNHLNIFATTAANSTESSYACYYDELRNAYVGDVYSVMWMENSDQVDLDRETLQKQFLVVKEETNTSHVKEYGDKSLRGLPVSAFQGHSTQKEVYPKLELDAVDSRDVPRIILERKISSSRTVRERKEAELQLSRLHKRRSLVTTQFTEILSQVVQSDAQEKTTVLRTRHVLQNFLCYEPVVKYYSAHCMSIAKNPYVMGKLYIFVNLCERGWSSEVMIEAMASTCSGGGSLNITGIN